MESYLSLPTSELLDGLVFSFGRRDGQDIWCVKRWGFRLAIWISLGTENTKLES